GRPPDPGGPCAGRGPGEWASAVSRRCGGLAALPPAPREGGRARGECALAAELWAEARKQLDAVAAAGGGGASHRLARLMARLEEGEHGDGAAVRRWLTAAAEAEPDPGWRCARCATLSARWQANRPNCPAFDS